MPPRKPTISPTAARSEAKTRKDLIDPALKKAGWDINNRQQVGIEIPVDGFDPAAWHALHAELKRIRDAHQIYEGTLPAGISDYALYLPNGEIIAVVEAKKTSIDPRLAQAQAEFYVREIGKHQSFQPFAFMTNGEEIYFLDAGTANKRLVASFFSPTDLENLLFIRQNKALLTATPINAAIVNRDYQHEAVRRVCETFEQGRHRALLVMATGTGKTRTAMALVDVFLRSNQARRILFIADRDVLVEQALNDGFKPFLPNEPRTRIFTHKIDTANRLYVATLQTMSVCFQQFTAGFFDLIIFDEVHRSIFNQWSEVLHYFDARMIGLTATPADFIERNTFLSFECPDGTPTFLYSYKQAAAEGHLVDYTLYVAKTKFQRKGIRGIDLGEEERNALIEQGLDPDDIDFSSTDLEKNVSNIDTLRRQWQEIMDTCLKDESGQYPGKTIVFAMTQDHALRLELAFEQMFPQFPGMVRVITSKSNYKGNLIEDFKKADQPRIAITVDLLETGVDVPEVVNLIFMKPVQSRIKLEQMIGRGTRSNEACKYRDRLPRGYKTEFLIMDFWENDFNRSATEELAQDVPVLVTIFNTRLKLLRHELSQQQSAHVQRLIADLREQIALIPTNSFSVKRLLPEVQSAWQDDFWRYLTADKLDFLARKVGPLLRYVPGVDVEAATFTSKVERLKQQILTAKPTAATVESIAADASRLPDFVYNDPQRKPLVQLCLSPQLATAGMDQLNQVIDALADQMRYRKDKQNSFILLDLPDFIEMRGYILLKGGSEPVYIDAYRQRVEQRIVALIDANPAIEALSRGAALSDDQLLDLERALRHELGADDLEVSEDTIRRAYGYKVGSLLEFLRQLFDLGGIPDYQEIVRRQFEQFIATHLFNADQLRFLRALQTVFLQRRRLHMADLYEPPLSNFGDDAVERWFSPDERDDILTLLDHLTVIGV